VSYTPSSKLQVNRVFEALLFFFRKKPLAFYTGIAAFSAAYSYVLALYFLEWSDFQSDLFNSMLLFSLAWLLFTSYSFIKNRDSFQLEREEEKFYLLQERIINEFDLSSESNIFEKIKFIQNFMQKNFSNKGLLSAKVLTLVNSTLRLYIENLEIKQHLNDALSLLNRQSPKREHIEKEIIKNNEQNSVILEYLDRFINELLSKKSNDKQVKFMLREFEHSMELMKSVTPRT